MNYDEIIKKIAIENKTSVEEIIKELEQTIDDAMQNPDPSIRKKWENIPRKGDKPTPAEFIAYISREAEKRLMN